ncbi:MAG: class I SAM-dependent methyltransferase [Thermogemmatispora sp.]|uniref:class I SAM-dependent methyltransferase n=1 Tax=Thermogemmatispora sp. TaxID=1968838 RepID=UPI00261160D4|nr:class I SAM-dependent methyltransferase [Thermogemmatispora sp.]MBX5457840.1 class I SAM-dependent methyltransferase [Thermogemmatispora sp.]
MLTQPGNRKPDYGIDAPGVVRVLTLVGLLLAGLAAWLLIALHLIWLAAWCIVWACVCLGEAVAMLWTSRVGKLWEIRRMLDCLVLCGDEEVLDVGCGRGMLLIEAARRLRSGHATGIDVWSMRDQSGNSPLVTQENARLAGVAERISVVTADARQLPFPSERFDVVVSCLALHNIHGQEERHRALREMLRVLKPGGKIAVLDLAHVKEYARDLQALGAGQLVLGRPSWRVFPPLRMLLARKLPAPASGEGEAAAAASEAQGGALA